MKRAIEDIDKNLAVSRELDVADCVFHNATDLPFKIYGLCDMDEENGFCRVPERVAQTAVTWGVKELSKHTSGGRVRFATNSEYIAIRCVMPSVSRFPHMPLTGSSGFDMYVRSGGKDIFEKSFVPPYDMTDGYSSVHHFGSRSFREITINLPAYNPLSALYIGLEAEAELLRGCGYKYEKPVVYYGSSITQGGCASRPGNTYPALISQMLDCDFINLGFSGTEMGEEAMVNYIKDLDMSVFVYDFDYNAHTMDYLTKTHKSVFKAIREEKPQLPIIILSPAAKTNYGSIEDMKKVVYQTYENALRAGDENVFIIDGETLYDGEFSSSCTVDYIHPSDAGFFRMASVIGDCVKAALLQYK